jgi:hypothetical protein
MIVAEFQIVAPRWRFWPSYMQTRFVLRRFIAQMPGLLARGYRKEWN